MSDDSQPLISIGLPVYNGEKFVSIAIESVLAQDYDRLEVIGVNDRSSDRTAEILERAASRNKRLRVISIDTLPEAAAPRYPPGISAPSGIA